ncbi:MAG: ABC transporter permease subunit, partial [Lachnospiraceae bacterium]|nr:ABC transporter permease subunit [Lachnospiraceae bacterium]
MTTSSIKTKRAISNTITYIVLIVISIIWLFPFVCMLLQSFRSMNEGGGGMVDYLLPKQFSLDSYTFLFSEESKFVRWYGNTLIIAFFVAILSTMMVLCVSYALSRMRFKGRTVLMRFWLILGMFPGFLSMICLYFLLKQLGLTQEGAIPGLILIGVASSGMGYYVTKGYFDTIPKALDEAARIDGASRARVFFTMILPMSKPIIIYALLT